MSDLKQLNIKNNTFTTILGSNETGKTSLGHIIKKNFDDAVIISPNSKYIEDISKLLDKSLDKKLNTLLKKLDIKKLLGFSFNTLSIGEKQLLQIASALLSNHKVIIFDNVLSYLSMVNKELVMKYLKQSSNKTIINITSNKEDIIYSNYTILIKDNDVINDKTIKLMSNESLFKEIGFSLPFMALLSLKLKYYDLMDKPLLDMNKMVNEIWK